MSIEKHFNPTFVANLALREKQVQQSYRPTIGVHKWFARRPGSVFRNLLLSEFNCQTPLETSYWHSHQLQGVIADPFMGGGTPIIEANRLGFSVVGTDINPMAYWIVRQTLASINIEEFIATATDLALEVENIIGNLYLTECLLCKKQAIVKYFFWVKTKTCPFCETENDLFPGYLIAENVRHPKNIVLCKYCGVLNEYDDLPTETKPEPCYNCDHLIQVGGSLLNEMVECQNCKKSYPYLSGGLTHPFKHRMYALEYHCPICKPNHSGRFFKVPDQQDLYQYKQACTNLQQINGLPIPEDEIPEGDETDRLHRWGYRYYRQMFNDRQLLGLGLLLRQILTVEKKQIRHALLTVFSDFLRYQNMLCRYDTYGLKCQDIFSIHGFPVGLIQCENNLLGISKVGSGAFRHFVEKYQRAKEYCQKPFEKLDGKKIPIINESIQTEFTDTFPNGGKRQARILVSSAEELPMPPQSLDGVFTDPPYFDNVQYAELIDFCFIWLRAGLRDEFAEFARNTTRTPQELTVNTTLGRDLAYFTQGLSNIFQHYASALKPGAPFVFTYHHNDPYAYVPLVVAILDSRMNCTVTLPTAAEMSASLHINGTSSSILDTIFVCRSENIQQPNTDVIKYLLNDINALNQAGLSLTKGDIQCLAAGHIARIATNQLYLNWDTALSLENRIVRAKDNVQKITSAFQINSLEHLYKKPKDKKKKKGREKSGTAI